MREFTRRTLNRQDERIRELAAVINQIHADMAWLLLFLLLSLLLGAVAFVHTLFFTTQ